MQDLSMLKTAELIGIHNGLAPDAPLKSWKRGKDILVDRIKVLRATVLSVPDTADATEAITVDDEPVNTIRSTAIELLCHVAYYEDRSEKPSDDNRVEATSPSARSVGIAYDEVIRRIKAKFPDCQTTVACLRWYSVKMRVEEHGYEGLRLPQRRPRVKPTKKA